LTIFNYNNIFRKNPIDHFDQISPEIWSEGEDSVLAPLRRDLTRADLVLEGVKDVLTALAVLERRFSKSDVKPF
jgi:hypothetical protein